MGGDTCRRAYGFGKDQTDAGVGNKHSAGRQPSGGSIGGILGPRIKSNGGSRSGLMDRVYDRLELREALRGQADTSAYDDTGIFCGSQVTLHRLPGRFIRTDETEFALPSPVCHLLQRKRNTGASLPYLYRARNLVERFFNKIKRCRRVATRYDKLAANYPAFIQLASIRLWLHVNESTP
jgi:transposase